MSAPTFARRRHGFPRLHERLDAGDEIRVVAFGGSLSRDASYLSSLGPALERVYAGAHIELARRVLPGFNCASASFRTQSALDLKPDLVVMEFAVHDVLLPASTISRAVEGIVRKVRANDPERDLAFVYFGEYSAVESGKMDQIVDAWERVAEHYAIPSFDGIALCRWLVEHGKAVWMEPWPGRRSWGPEDGTVVLTHEGLLHTQQGGRFLGGYIAEALVGMLAGPRHTLRDLAPPFERQHWGDAVWVPPSALACNGWIAGPLPGPFDRRWSSAFFDECVAALAPGSQMRLRFAGRYATLWTLQGSEVMSAYLDGKRVPLDNAAGGEHRWHNLLNAAENRAHTIEIVAENLPAVIAGIDILGRVPA